MQPALPAVNHLSPRAAPAPDWSRARRAVFEVRKRYRYTYTSPISNLTQRLVMVPPDRHEGQRLLDFTCDVRGAAGAPRVAWETDAYGNRVCWVRLDAVPQEVEFEVAYRVERRAGRPTASPALSGGPTVTRAGSAASAADHEPTVVASEPCPQTCSCHHPEALLRPTALTAPDAALRAVAASIAATTNRPYELAERAHDWASTAITYKTGITSWQTPAAMALYLGRGVCQDFAHLLLCVLRLLRVPARYVSGHLLGEGVPHAWVEALLPNPDAPGGVEVVAYDPTHHRRAGLSYITVAVGRDFQDVTPTSGTFTGRAAGALSFSKQAHATEVAYA